LAEIIRGYPMKKIAVAAALMLSAGIAAGPADAQSRPGGCLKYGLGGAVAGHFAGGHRIKGALAGCALGIYQRRRYEREAREQDEIRNRIPERRRAPNPRSDDGFDNRDRSANRTPLPRAPSPRQEGASPYEDLGLGRDRTAQQRDGHTPGGAFARGQQESRGRLENRQGAPDSIWLRRSEPEETGSFPRSKGQVY
jgi:hypothetical protein